MKPFDIKKYNMLCAELLGFENKTPDDKDFNIHFHKDEKSGKGVEILGKHITSIETNFGRMFTTDWNWIMKVVEKISDMTKFKTVDECSEAEWYVTTNVTKATLTSSKEQVVQAIWAFLNWYKEQKK